MACSTPLTDATYKMPPSSIGAERTELPARNCQTARSGDRAGCCPCPPVRALSLSSVGQSPWSLDLAVSVVINSGRERTVIDLLQVCDAKAELTSRCNMSWLAEEQVLRRVTIKVITVCCDAVRIVLPQGRCAPFAALRFNGLQFDGVQCDWIGCYEENAGLIDEILNLGQRSAMPYLTHAVHDMQDSLRA